MAVITGLDYSIFGEEIVTTTSRLDEAYENFLREQHILELKETHSKKYLLSHKLITPEEYDNHHGESLHHLHNRRLQEASEISRQVLIG